MTPIGEPPLRVLDDEGRETEGARSSLDDRSRLGLYRTLVLVRRLDERLLALARQGRIGFHGSALGQEAVPVGAAFALRAEDWIFPGLREGAALIARGFPLERYLAQAFGSAEDVAKGRQMPSHAASRAVRCVSWSSAIATQLPQAVGSAFAAQGRGDGVISLVFFGDGATSHPDFHAALTFAGVLAAPVVFVCVNNQYALSLPATRQSAASTFAVKGVGYGVPGRRVDGNDPLAVHAAVAAAAERARAGEGPTLIECVTYRLGAHSTSDDPSRYRSSEEERVWALRDPLLLFERHLTALGLLDAKAAEGLRAAVDREIAAALETAERVGPPERASLFDDVYASRPWHLEEQRLRFLRER